MMSDEMMNDERDESGASGDPKTACGFAILQGNATPPPLHSYLQLLRLPPSSPRWPTRRWGSCSSSRAARTGSPPPGFRRAGHARRRLQPAVSRRHGAERRVRRGDRPPRAARAADPLGPHPVGNGTPARLAAAGPRRGRGHGGRVLHRQPPLRGRGRDPGDRDSALRRLAERTPLGPVGMGACRMLNVLLGMSAIDRPRFPPAVARGRGDRRLRDRHHAVCPNEAERSGRCHWPRRRW